MAESRQKSSFSICHSVAQQQLVCSIVITSFHVKVSLLLFQRNLDSISRKHCNVFPCCSHRISEEGLAFLVNWAGSVAFQLDQRLVLPISRGQLWTDSQHGECGQHYSSLSHMFSPTSGIGYLRWPHTVHIPPIRWLLTVGIDRYGQHAVEILLMGGPKNSYVALFVIPSNCKFPLFVAQVDQWPTKTAVD